MIGISRWQPVIPDTINGRNGCFYNFTKMIWLLKNCCSSCAQILVLEFYERDRRRTDQQHFPVDESESLKNETIQSLKNKILNKSKKITESMYN